MGPGIDLRFVLAATAVALLSCAPAAQRRAATASAGDALDWSVLEAETVVLLQRLIREKTVNPPGNEGSAAAILLELFRSEGIESGTAECVPGRTNVWARLPGNGSARALVLQTHLDVVPVEEGWSVDPFSGIVKDGYVWGRGALDVKGYTAQQAIVLRQLHRRKVPLTRDVIFLATADEESGSHAGADCILAQHRALLRDAEFVVTEPMYARLDPGGRTLDYNVSTVEKAPLWVRISARAESGSALHAAYVSSKPYPAQRLVAALGRILAWTPPVDVQPLVRNYLAARAHEEKPPWNERFKDLAAAMKDPKVAAEYEREKQVGLVRDTCALTQLTGSPKENIIATVATALLDCRLLPGHDPAEMLATIKRLAADDTLQIEAVLTWNAATPSRGDGAVMDAIRALAAREDPGVPVHEAVLIGFSDCHSFRSAGIDCYGWVPWKNTAKERAGVHGPDERISLENLREGNRRLYEVVSEVAGR